MSALMSDAEIAAAIIRLPEWTHMGGRIERRFRFTDFEALMGFINGLATISRELDHHPDVQFGYADCTVSYTTHSASGLTARDFAAASRVNAL